MNFGHTPEGKLPEKSPVAGGNPWFFSFIVAMWEGKLKQEGAMDKGNE